MSQTPSIEIRSLSYFRGTRQVLEDVSITAVTGEVLAIVGPNGAGKSTLLHLLAGDLIPTHGEILLNGHPLSYYAPRDLARQRAVLPQQTLLQFPFLAREVVAMGRSPHHSPLARESASDWAIVRDTMQRTETLTLAERTFPQLSGGEQSLVTLARVLAQETPILLLDEPTSSLDIHHQELVMDLAKQMAAEGALVIIIVHDLNSAACHAQRIALLAQGRLVALGAPWDVFTDERLSDAFHHAITVVSHPIRGYPLIVP